MGCGVNGLGGGWIRTLLDYQRFKGDPGLADLIEDTVLRHAHKKAGPFALPDDAVAALSGAQGEAGNVLCALCGAVLRGEEALLEHMMDRHPSAQP